MERFTGISAPDYSRFRNRIRISPSGTSAPYVGLEAFVDATRLRSMRYSAGIRRRMTEELMWTWDTFMSMGDAGSSLTGTCSAPPSTGAISPHVSTPIVILGNWVSADSARMSADADARLGGSSMLIAEPVRQNHAWPCGRERWGGTEDIRAAVDLNRSRERFG